MHDKYNYCSYLATGQYIFYITQIALGMMFVNTITLRGVRKNPFYSATEEYSSFNPYNLTVLRFRVVNSLPQNWNKDKEYETIK